MIEILLFIVASVADQALKLWSVNVLQFMPAGSMPLIDGLFYLYYAENYGDNVSFIRGRSIIMTAVRLAQVALVVYLLIKQRKRLAGITRIALVLFLAGMVANQLNYFVMNFVPDMFLLVPIGNFIFNLADVYVFISMLILFVRLAFYEGQTFVDYVMHRFAKKQVEQEPPDQSAPQPQAAVQEGLPCQPQSDAPSKADENENE